MSEVQRILASAAGVYVDRNAVQAGIRLNANLCSRGVLFSPQAVCHSSSVDGRTWWTSPALIHG